MNWIKLTIEIPDEKQELLIAELLDLDIDSFEQFDNRMNAWISASRWDDVKREELEQTLNRSFPDSRWQSEEITEQNWNAEWEKSITPVRAGSFHIQPTWLQDPVEKDLTLIYIDPKMSFGTGLHPTTRLMLHFVDELVTPSTRQVIDVGTGTGLLSIASIKHGASHAFAFDIDPWSRENALENCHLNHVSESVDIREGGVEVIPETLVADLMLANINRNTLKAILPLLIDHLDTEGTLVISGLLRSDRSSILKTAEELSLSLIKEKSEGEWIALGFERKD